MQKNRIEKNYKGLRPNISVNHYIKSNEKGCIPIKAEFGRVDLKT